MAREITKNKSFIDDAETREFTEYTTREGSSDDEDSDNEKENN